MHGVHWEWRGFGAVPTAVRNRIENLTAPFDTPDVVTDEYLWVPGSRINVKLRRKKDADTLKFKRLRDIYEASELELWEERENEEYRFPVSGQIAASLGTALGVTIADPTEPVTRDALLLMLQRSDERIKVVTVKKTRRARNYPTSLGRLVVEIAEIEFPERVSSVGIEDEFRLQDDSKPAAVESARSAVSDAIEDLQLSQTMRAMNYLEAAAQWAQGYTLST